MNGVLDQGEAMAILGMAAFFFVVFGGMVMSDKHRSRRAWWIYGIVSAILGLPPVLFVYITAILG